MKVSKFSFIKSLLQSSEWQDEVAKLSDDQELEYLESLYEEYKVDFKNGHFKNPAQFLEWHLQVKYQHID